MKVITLVTTKHTIKEISILYTQSVLADCLSRPDLMRAECLLHKVASYDFVYIFKLCLSILYSLQLVNLKPIENKMTVVQGKLKSMHIICIYVMYVAINIIYYSMIF